MSPSEIDSGDLAFCLGENDDGPASWLIVPAGRELWVSIEEGQAKVVVVISWSGGEPRYSSCHVVGFLCNAMLYYFLSRYKLYKLISQSFLLLSASAITARGLMTPRSTKRPQQITQSLSFLPSPFRLLDSLLPSISAYLTYVEINEALLTPSD
jgi:hypothetical protein